MKLLRNGKLHFHRPKTAAVLGAGPAGIFAAQRLHDEGYEVSVYSKGPKSKLYGAQYLHRPIPHFSVESVDHVHFDTKEGRRIGAPMTLAGTPLQYLLNGSADGYREKVYGENSTVRVSPESLAGEHMAWDIRAAYDEGWKRWRQKIERAKIEAYDVPHMMKTFNKVVSTIPLRDICLGGHKFESSRIWAIGDAPKQQSPVRVAEMTVECDGTRERGWYRASNVFGWCTVEYPGGKKPPIAGVAPVEKPIQHNCTCHPGLVLAGRYGRWTKGVLADSAYWDLQL